MRVRLCRAVVAALAGALLAGVVSVADADARVQAKWCASKACVKRDRAERRQQRREFRRQMRARCTWVHCPPLQRAYWRRRRAELPDAMRGLLRALRGCETRGLAFPSNYRYRGNFRGAYQYDFGTWGEAGGRGDPGMKIPAEQDVRTARFYPGHESRWPNCP